MLHELVQCTNYVRSLTRKHVNIALFTKQKEIWIPGALNFIMYVLASHVIWHSGNNRFSSKTLDVFLMGLTKFEIDYQDSAMQIQLSNEFSFASNLNTSSYAWESVFVGDELYFVYLFSFLLSSFYIHACKFQDLINSISSLHVVE
ncbi:hypothetical protein DVH24_026773 [Malus domestica]|uniref:Uncharacterized protein n=1 Tax=Malus domestica TaxID=3750 RepID=A0A498K9G5_MALDO|nr:hypothetical protein DVH24_026773 [Malus domestica]